MVTSSEMTCTILPPPPPEYILVTQNNRAATPERTAQDPWSDSVRNICLIPSSWRTIVGELPALENEHGP